jgi:TolB protein
MFVELVRDGIEETTNLTAGLGGPPFYYSWSPDGGRMLWQRNNSRLDIYDANEDRVVNTLPQTPGAIFAPAWSPVDDRLLFGTINDDQTTDLVIVGQDATTVLAAGFTGLVSYNWSPDGNQIAYREASSTGFGPLVVVDAISGEVVSRSPTTGVISFFWAPDSRQVAYLTLAASPDSFSAQGPQGHVLAQNQQQPIGIAWSILDTSTGDVRQYGSFFPTRESLYLLQFFDQFAQSHRIWSPDSRYLIYSEITEAGPVISVQDTSQDGSVPFSIAEGIIGIWSFA